MNLSILINKKNYTRSIKKPSSASWKSKH